MTTSLLEQGIAAARAGQRDQARALLMQVVEANEHDEQAWLWLSRVVEDPADVRTCLENVLDLNPDNAQAKQALAQLDQPTGAAAAPSAPPPDTAALLTLIGAAQPENPCPFCGAATALSDKRCPRCRQQLTVRLDGDMPRSRALTILAWLWGIGGALSLLGAALLFFAMTSLQRSGVFLGMRAADLTQAGVQLSNATPRMLGSILYGLIELVIARGLFGRRRWAWIVSTILQVLQLLLSLAVVIFLAVGIRLMLSNLPASARIGSSIVGVIFTLILLIAFAPQILGVLLLFFSYGDVFAPTQRIIARVGHHNPTQHYTNGLAYKDRGMWYMAAQEWAAAVQQTPGEPMLLHALGLAYIKTRQFDLARATLDYALQIAPGDAQIAGSRALVDREAKGSWW